MMDSPGNSLAIGLMWRGDPANPPAPESTRFRPIFEALAAMGAEARTVLWDEAAEDAVRRRLAGLDGLLVWVDPISDAGTRARLDPLLREIAAGGTWVSAHPDVIQKMGTKDVLVRTRDLGWGVDSHLHATPAGLAEALPGRLAAGPRVLKQRRGNGGIGVWKVAAAGDGRVEVLHARRGSLPETLTLADFLERCAGYFDDGGAIIDQPFQPRLPEGMIRCYCSRGTVVGYGRQLIKALMPTPPEGPDSPEAQPGPRIMHPPEAEPFQALRRAMEDDWIPGLQRLLDIETADLPALWDADFLLGPKDGEGRDTYVLCEINCSSVAPFPATAAPVVAEAAVAGARARRQ
ncbi:MAG TPA: Cj0069 family protein [Caulobacter sp.]|nr:Cj0069 family protein [Caulobacter sp.]